MPRGATVSGRSRRAIVAILAGFANKTRSTIGAGVALRTHGTGLSSRAELAVVARST